MFNFIIFTKKKKMFYKKRLISLLKFNIVKPFVSEKKLFLASALITIIPTRYYFRHSQINFTYLEFSVGLQYYYCYYIP